MTHCPRVHCRGLLLTRKVRTDEGRLEEVYCPACSRIYAAQSEDGYRPYRVRFRPDVEAFLGQRAGFFDRKAERERLFFSNSAGQDNDDNGGNVPLRIAHALEDVDTTFLDESPPTSPLDTE